MRPFCIVGLPILDLVPGRQRLMLGRRASRRSPMHLARFIMPALVLVLVPTLRQANQPDDDPPSRVGRLSFRSGGVSFRPATVDDWTDATINYPLHGGDHLWTDADARAELTVGSNAMRLAPQSAFGFLALDDRTTQVRLSQGSLEVRVRNLGDDDSFEIDTPAGAVSLLRPGTYRVDVDPTGDTTTLTVRHGRSEEHTSELQSQSNLVCRLLLEKKKHASRTVDACLVIRATQAVHLLIARMLLVDLVIPHAHHLTPCGLHLYAACDAPRTPPRHR